MLTEEQKQLLIQQIIESQQDAGPSIEDAESSNRRNQIIAAIGAGLSGLANSQAVSRGLNPSNTAQQQFEGLSEQSSSAVQKAVAQRRASKAAGAKSAQEMLFEDAKQQAAADLQRARIAADDARSKADRESKKLISDNEIAARRTVEADKIAAAKADSGLKPSPGQKTMDETFAKQEGENLAAGSATSAANNIKSLRGAAEKLRASKEGGFVDRIQGAAYSIAPKSISSAVAPDFAQIEAQVNDAVFTMLKEFLGSQFAAKETEIVMKNNFNPSLGNDRIADRVDQIADRMQSLANSKEEVKKYFKEHKTLDGFVLSPVSPSGFPKQVVHQDGRTATVANAEEEAEANSEGFK